jgi:hypothetical protein
MGTLVPPRLTARGIEDEIAAVADAGSRSSGSNRGYFASVASHTLPDRRCHDARTR